MFPLLSKFLAKKFDYGIKKSSVNEKAVSNPSYLKRFE